MTVDDFLHIVSNMKHSLGLDVTKLRKGQSVYNAYRNYFWGDDKYLDMAYKLKFVDRKVHLEQSMYTINEDGLNFLSNIFGIKIIYEP